MRTPRNTSLGGTDDYFGNACYKIVDWIYFPGTFFFFPSFFKKAVFRVWVLGTVGFSYSRQVGDEIVPFKSRDLCVEVEVSSMATSDGSHFENVVRLLATIPVHFQRTNLWPYSQLVFPITYSDYVLQILCLHHQKHNPKHISPIHQTASVFIWLQLPHIGPCIRVSACPFLTSSQSVTFNIFLIFAATLGRKVGYLIYKFQFDSVITLASATLFSTVAVAALGPGEDVTA